MGLKLKSVVIALYLMMILSVGILILPLYWVMRVYFLPFSNLFIVFGSFLLFSMSQMSSIIFFVFTLGRFGVLIYFLIQIVGAFVQAFTAVSPISGPVMYYISAVIPSMGFG